MISQQRKKPMFSVTIEKELLEAFNFCAKKNSINKSLWVQNKLKEYIETKEPEIYKKYASNLKGIDSFIKMKKR